MDKLNDLKKKQRFSIVKNPAILKTKKNLIKYKTIVQERLMKDMQLNMEFDLQLINKENKRFKELFIQNLTKNKKEMMLQI